MSQETQETLESLSDPAAQLAAVRSRAYGAFAELFEYPDDELYEAVCSGTLVQVLQDVLGAVDSSLVEGGRWEALTEAGEKDDLAVEFTRLFDVGAGGPPCPLYGGLYVGARMKTMEEVVRFYNHFGLTLSESPRELPDHVTTELEFLHFLAFREAQAIEQGAEPDPFRRAQRDFIARHLGRWIPKLRAKLEGADAMPFFPELVGRLERLLENELERLVGMLGRPPTGSVGSTAASGR
jgi:DMSO reductase family type II enzyme chaperone